ncbi:major facilitator superfamily transporter [Dioszegia hungarica]|uniref:Major facilitator superfamily transporter n=1 Tax=Dioszegia hungarica TaxID=4972 RepID=A0AA38H5L8_9TREE|nr:major facilitator superfamily transporter [Dioszegia hungarica]KAI9634398.1 major facilitator superfamily transporter [Dioszegia hungarica]
MRRHTPSPTRPGPISTSIPTSKGLPRKPVCSGRSIFMLMYILNYIDRTNIGNAKSGGMEKDLNLTSSEYSLIVSIFFVSYLLFEVPANMILARSRPSIFLPSIMFIWGAMSIGVKGVESLGGMVAWRFCLGIAEAGFFPGVMLLMSCWYKPAELSKRVAFFYTASLLSGAFGGLLAGGIITGMEGLSGTRGWKWLFIIEGAATALVAVAAFFVLPDYPATTKWLTEEEKALAISRVSTGLQAGGEAEMDHKTAFFASVRDPRTWGFLIGYNLITCAGTISYFFPTLMGALGYTGSQVQFMTVPIYFVALAIAMAAGFNADRTGQKAYHVMGACAAGCVSFIVCSTVSDFKVRYVFICFGGAGIWTAVPIYLSFEGREKRAISIALINGFGNLASVYGSFLWPSSDAPTYKTGFGVTTALLGSASLLAFGLKWKYGDRGVMGRAAQQQ